MQARYYDPVTGHFLSTDPVEPRAGDAFNFNRYAYVNNNPIVGFDPTGMEDDCGSGCMLMRRLSDYFSGIGRGILGGSSGMTGAQGPLGQAQSAITYMNGATNEDLASASAAVAPVADAVPGLTLVGCIDAGHCSGGDVIMGGLAVLPGEGIEMDALGIGAARILKPVNLPAWRRISIDMEHIASGHMVGGSRLSPLKSLFPESMSVDQVEKAVRQAYRYGERVATQGNRVLVRGEHGGTRIEMWVNTDTRTIETAYPISR
jgi:hypothetical protein